MASSYQLLSTALLAQLLLCFSSALSNAKPFLSVPVSKQPSTGRFVAEIFHGTDPNHQAVNLVLDLGGPVTRLPCHRSSSSSTHRHVSCPSLQCAKAGGTAVIARLGDQLVEDMVAVGSVDSVHSAVDRFLFHCTTGSSAVLGLGRSKMSLPSQFSMTHFLDRKFPLCLSAAGNVSRLLIGDALAGTDISRTLIYTPLLPDSQSHPTHHFIPVKSIKIGSIDSDPVKVNGRARLSTTAPFTTLKSSIYQTFVNKFVKAVITSSSNSNVTVVTDWSAWAPFKTCFVVGKSNAVFPEVDLVLQSEMVKWRIGAGNLMVEVDKEKGVSCLGIFDGGSENEDEIVIGRYQLVENIMEFDMGRSMLGFRSTTSCAELKMLDSRHTIPRQSQSSSY